MITEQANRYATDWNWYSDYWDKHYTKNFSHLGDEWHNRDFEDRFFPLFVERFLTPDSTVLEIGPGGGKWTIRYAPLVKKVIVLDVAENMLERTRRRCDEAGLQNVEYVLGDGSSFPGIADNSVDFVFSFDVLVHVALEDTWPYALECARVMVPGAAGVLHHAINTVPDAWGKIAKENDWYRGGAHTLGQFYYHSPEALRQLYERAGLSISEQYQRYWHCVNVIHKNSPVVTRLESLLASLLQKHADEPARRETLIAELQELPAALAGEIRALTEKLRAAGTADARADISGAIRRTWRGL